MLYFLYYFSSELYVIFCYLFLYSYMYSWTCLYYGTFQKTSFYVLCTCSGDNPRTVQSETTIVRRRRLLSKTTFQQYIILNNLCIIRQRYKDINFVSWKSTNNRFCVASLRFYFLILVFLISSSLSKLQILLLIT